MKAALSKLTYGGKHAAPLGVDLMQHAQRVHARRTQLSQMKKQTAFHKTNTMAKSLPTRTKMFSLIDNRVKGGQSQTFALFPSNRIVTTHQAHSGASLTSTEHGRGYMEALQNAAGQSVHHEGVRQPHTLSQMPYFGSAPVTDPTLMQQVAAHRARYRLQLPAPSPSSL
ncbi:hypothetical protein [Paraburkholderia solisilvae]|uniref:Uncharacterized protein n=1 Tax=Paraburkholderia solisilvae TaxID=624376 RepID=A0A6J5DRW2_9BURK|nr:hypothetical protein [Paraburkholderia solisilvae]CAB3755616.1 hypothetical protein LMG29739_02216 [Paraburkholderia solisilvae]